MVKKFGLISVLLVYLSLCVLFGGAGREGRFAHALLQSAAAIGISVLAIGWPVHLKSTPIRTPIVLVLVLVSIAFLHSVPMPERLWQVLPGRGRLIDGFHSVGVPLGSMPLSFNVEATLSTIGYALPPLFIMLLCLRAGLRQLKTVMPWFILVVAVLSVALGVTQLISGSDSALYFYEMTNVDFPVGTFANVNHFASFILLSLPSAFFLLRKSSRDWYQSDAEIAKTIAICGALVILVMGIVAAGSLAVYLLSLPVGVAATFAIRKQDGSKLNVWARTGIIAVLFAAISLAATSPLLYGLGAVDLSDGHLSRLNIWSMTWEAVEDHWPVGTGIGTYPSVIPLYEDPNSVTSTYVARAHNEYLQMLMEAGALGAVVILVALLWLGRRIWSVWRTQSRGSEAAFKKVASISILAVVIHSIVDFPLRTPAIAAYFAFFVAVIALSYRDPLPRKNNPSREPIANPKRVVL